MKGASATIGRYSTAVSFTSGDIDLVTDALADSDDD